jgi:hypothetical protein
MTKSAYVIAMALGKMYSFAISMVVAPTSLEDLLQFHRNLRDLGTLIVLVGVVSEILIDEFWEISHPPLLRGVRATTVLPTKTAFLKRCVMLLAGVGLVGGGIALEYWQGKKADDVADNIRILSQQDIIKAGWRQVNESHFIGFLAGEPTGNVRILYKHEDTEAYFVALQIYNALVKARWAVDGKPVSIPLSGGDPYFAQEDVPSDIRYDCSSGLTVWVHSVSSAEGNPAADAFQKALGLGVDRSGVVLLTENPAVPPNHFWVIVGQNAPINLPH